MLFTPVTTVTQSCPTLCNPVDYTVHGILQARILESVAFPFSGDPPDPEIELRPPALQADSLPTIPIITNYHKIRALKQHKFTISPLWMLEVRKGFHWAKIKLSAGLQSICFLAFPAPRGLWTSGLGAYSSIFKTSSIASSQSPRLCFHHHISFSDSSPPPPPPVSSLQGLCDGIWSKEIIQNNLPISRI